MLGMVVFAIAFYVVLLLVVWALLFAHGRRYPIRPPHS